VTNSGGEKSNASAAAQPDQLDEVTKTKTKMEKFDKTLKME
jgi:hypothetical protein